MQGPFERRVNIFVPNLDKRMFDGQQSVCVTKSLNIFDRFPIQPARQRMRNEQNQQGCIFVTLFPLGSVILPQEFHLFPREYIAHPDTFDGPGILGPLDKIRLLFRVPIQRRHGVQFFNYMVHVIAILCLSIRRHPVWPNQ